MAPSLSLHSRSVKLIVREIAVSMFGVFSCDTLDSYFQLCREDDMRSPTQSVKGGSLSFSSRLVQRKVADMSFSGVLNSISSTLLPKHASISKGSSESFFGTTAAFTEASTPSVDSTDEGGAFSLTSSLHLPAHHVRLSNSPQFSPNPVLFDENTESCRKNYRRLSVACVALPHDGIGRDGGLHDGISHDGDLHDGIGRDGDSHDGIGRDGDLHDGIAHDITRDDGTPAVTLHDGISRGAAMHDGISEKDEDSVLGDESDIELMDFPSLQPTTTYENVRNRAGFDR